MKNILITGGTSGIGLATAQQLLLNSEDTSIIITGSNSQKMEMALAKLGTNAQGIIADNAQMTDIHKLTTKVAHKVDKLDGLFINAGICVFSSIADMSEEKFDKQMIVNFKSAFFTIQKLIPILSENSSIVLTSSIVTQQAFANTGAYTASKSALEGIAQVLNVELADKKIRTNIIAPGITLTSVFERAGLSQDEIDKLAENQNTLLARILEPEEIANAVCYLLSDKSIAMRNARLVIDGGYTI